MRYADFEWIMSVPRMDRYRAACGKNSRKAMTLYRYNLQLSQQLFTIISCFEISLRNKIDTLFLLQNGDDWLKNAISPGGMFSIHPCQNTARLAWKKLNKLRGNYAHNKLIAEMDFGFWRYLFAQPQFYASGRTLLQIFPAKPKSTPAIQYNNTYIFNELGKINDLRNRIAHHEPICFRRRTKLIDTAYARSHYLLILQLWNWMQIDGASLLYGVNHVPATLKRIDQL